MYVMASLTLQGMWAANPANWSLISLTGHHQTANIQYRTERITRDVCMDTVWDRPRLVQGLSGADSKVGLTMA